MKRVLILLIAAGLASAATGVAPPEAFSAPTSDNVAQNPDFWSGYSAGSIVPIVLPDAMYPDWWGYIAAVRVNEMPRTRLFIPINYNVGFDSAEETAAGYLWTHWETSCGVVVCGASPSAKKRKSLGPKQVTHLDLIERGVKATVKMGYRGARVIL